MGFRYEIYKRFGNWSTFRGLAPGERDGVYWHGGGYVATCAAIICVTEGSKVVKTCVCFIAALRARALARLSVCFYCTRLVSPSVARPPSCTPAKFYARPPPQFFNAARVECEMWRINAHGPSKYLPISAASFTRGSQKRFIVRPGSRYCSRR